MRPYLESNHTHIDLSPSFLYDSGRDPEGGQFLEKYSSELEECPRSGLGVLL